MSDGTRGLLGTGVVLGLVLVAIALEGLNRYWRLKALQKRNRCRAAH
jgi:hypothetical protein